MKKYFFEADKKQWEKPTQPKYLFCAPARLWVAAENEEAARAAALEKLRGQFGGTGVLVDDEHLRLTGCVDLPEDWNYGYGDDRGAGSAEDRQALLRGNHGSL